MSTLEIVTYPDHRLRAPTKWVEDINQEIIELVSNMIDTMFHHNAVGLAAIQVGRPERIFILDSAAVGRGQDPIVFVNPEIINLSDEEIIMEEGCLSFPETFIKIKRPTWTKVRFTNIDEEETTIEVQGLFSRAIQHEIDHLNGRLLIDMANFLDKKRIKKKYK